MLHLYRLFTSAKPRAIVGCGGEEYVGETPFISLILGQTKTSDLRFYSSPNEVIQTVSEAHYNNIKDDVHTAKMCVPITKSDCL